MRSTAPKSDEPATSPELRAAVRALVNEPWSKTADGLTRAQAAFQQADAIAPHDVRIDYAWALMQLRYLRFDEAEKTLLQVIAVDGHAPGAPEKPCNRATMAALLLI